MMRPFFLASIFLTALPSLAGCGNGSAPAQSALPASTTSSAADAAAVGDSVARLAAAWNAGSGAKWAAEYWPEGELVNILGVVFVGAPAVGAVTSSILAGPFAGSRYEAAIRATRFLSPDVALVETDVRVTNFRALPPGAVPTAPGLLLTRFTHLFARRAGVWRIVFSQNTAVLPKPAPVAGGRPES